MNSSSETTVQWQPVQVGGTLPTPEVCFNSYSKIFYWFSSYRMYRCLFLSLISSSDETAAPIAPNWSFFNEIVPNCAQVWTIFLRVFHEIYDFFPRSFHNFFSATRSRNLWFFSVIDWQNSFLWSLRFISTTVCRDSCFFPLRNQVTFTLFCVIVKWNSRFFVRSLNEIIAFYAIVKRNSRFLRDR